MPTPTTSLTVPEIVPLSTALVPAGPVAPSSPAQPIIASSERIATTAKNLRILPSFLFVWFGWIGRFSVLVPIGEPKCIEHARKEARRNSFAFRIVTKQKNGHPPSFRGYPQVPLGISPSPPCRIADPPVSGEIPGRDRGIGEFAYGNEPDFKPFVPDFP